MTSQRGAPAVRAPTKPGKVTVADRLGDELKRVRWQAPGAKPGSKEAAVTERYVIVLEGDATSNYSAYVPDLPGCIATGATIEETVRLIREAMALHLWPFAEMAMRSHL